MALSIRGKFRESHSSSAPPGEDARGVDLVVYLLFGLATVPAWALLTYPGWFELRTGYFPYFNLFAWLRSPTVLWRPPYSIPPHPPVLPLVEAGAAFLYRVGWSPLSALRAVEALGLIGGSGVIFRLLRSRGPVWAAWTAALLWLYAPPTVCAVYRGGFWGIPWMGVGLLALLAWVWRKGVWSRRLYGVGLGAFLLVWGVRRGDPVARWEVCAALMGLTVLGLPAVVHYLRALRRPVLAFLLVAAAAVWSLPENTPHYQAYVPPPRPTAFFPEAEILLLDVKQEGEVAPGGVVHLTVHWQSLRPQSVRWTAFVQVLDAGDRIRGQVDVPLGGTERPVTEWRRGEVVRQAYTVQVDAGARGPLRLIIGVYDPSTVRRLLTQDGRDHVVLLETHP